MTIHVEFGLANGITIPDTYFILGSATRGILGTHVLADSNTLADYSDRIRALTVEHNSNRTGPLVEYEARTCTLELLNDDGVLDPWTLEEAGLEAPGVLMRVRKEHNGIMYPVFYGTVDSWLPTTHSPTHATVTVTGTDGFKLLASPRQELVGSVGGGEATGARVTRILNAASWPAADRSISAGQNLLAATTMPGTALDELQTVAHDEIGEFYIQPDNVAYFRDRHSTYTDARSTTVQATFGHGVGEIPFVGSLGFSWDRQQVINMLRATRPGGVMQDASDAGSIGRYGERARDEEVNLMTDADVQEWATAVVSMTYLPESRFTELEINTAVDPDVMFPQALGRRFGDRVAVVRRPPGGIVDSRDQFLRGVSHSWSSDRGTMWITKWSLAPATSIRGFVLGSATNGILGVNRLVY